MAMAVASSAAAQNAMRAPLNIVPPVMQQAIGQPKAERRSNKLAPRVAARQSKRAVRAVAAAPGSESGIVQVGQLGALQDAPIGLETGYGSELWRGARLAFIADQMARLPKDLPLAALREAELKLHRSTTAAPVGTVDGSSWYSARLNRFLALGDTASVLQLEQLTGAVSNDPYAARAIVLAHLGGGATEAACAIAAPKRGTRGYADTLSFFMQLLVYCQLRAGEFEKAGLTLQLNEKSLGEDRFYRDLAFLMSAQAQPIFGTAEDVAAAKAEEKQLPLIVPSVLTPMQLALLQLAGYGLSIDLQQLPPYFMRSLAEDYAQPAGTQLGAALAAMRHGTLTAERFSQLSQLADLSAYQIPVAPLAPLAGLDSTFGDDEAGAESAEALPANDAVFLALSLLEVDSQMPKATGRAEQMALLISALADAQARGLWRDMVHLLDDRLRAIDAPLGASGLAAASASPTASEIMAPDLMRAALIPAMRLLQGLAVTPNPETLNPETLNPETLNPGLLSPETLNSEALSPVAERLLAFGAQAQPLENLIASLSDALPDTPISAPTDPAINDQSGFNDLPVAAGGDDAPADTRPHPIADWEKFAADYAAASPALKTYLTRELAVYQGLGFEFPDAYQALGAADAAQADSQRVQKLADNKWIGDLLLALVDMYGEETAASLTNPRMIALLAALRQAYLHQEAENLAAELLLNAAGRLSLTDPTALLASPAAGTELVTP
jgi:hypothetical protein